MFPALKLHAEFNQVRLTAELVDWEDFIFRGIWNWYAAKVFVLAKSDEIPIIGFSTPVFVLGPLVPAGLLREIMNPLAYKATSGVFGETTDLTLTASLSGSSYWGIGLKPWPQNCLFYYLGQKDTPFSLGAVCRLNWEKIIIWESLISTSAPCSSVPEGQEQEEDWFLDKPPFPGGRLLHLASRIKLRGENLFALATAALSAGTLTVPGFFMHLLCGYDARALACSFIFGYADRDYVNPAGRYNDKNLVYGGNICYKPFSWLSLTGEYQRVIEHSALLPAAYRPGREVLSSLIEFFINLESHCLLYLKGQHLVRFEYMPGEQDKIAHDVKFQAGLEWNGQKITGEIVSYSMGLPDQRTLLGLNLDIAIAVINIILDLELENTGRKISCSGSAGIYLVLGNNKFYLKAGSKKSMNMETFAWQELRDTPFEFVFFTLGWESTW